MCSTTSEIVLNSRMGGKKREKGGGEGPKGSSFSSRMFVSKKEKKRGKKRKLPEPAVPRVLARVSAAGRCRKKKKKMRSRDTLLLEASKSSGKKKKGKRKQSQNLVYSGSGMDAARKKEERGGQEATILDLPFEWLGKGVVSTHGGEEKKRRRERIFRVRSKRSSIPKEKGRKEEEKTNFPSQCQRFRLRTEGEKERKRSVPALFARRGIVSGGKGKKGI